MIEFIGNKNNYDNADEFIKYNYKNKNICIRYFGWWEVIFDGSHEDISKDVYAEMKGYSVFDIEYRNDEDKFYISIG